VIDRSWYQLTFCLNESYHDLLVGIISPLGFSGFLQDKNSLYCIIPAHVWNSSLQKKFRIILCRFKSEFPALELHYTTSKVREENWNNAWEQQTGIVVATSHIIIKPSWTKLPIQHRNKTILHIDPKMSFGTGHHETTRLSLSLLEQFIHPGMRVLDFGCGTGVLGIASIKLGAHSVFAIDNDPWAIENARENVKRNHVQNNMKICLGSVSAIPRIKYDLLIANIDYLTITRFIKSFSIRILKNGFILFSGILTSDLPELLHVMKNRSLVPLEIRNENEWSAIALWRT
jgi:ribosomal protein L11 methyltransferase